MGSQKAGTSWLHENLADHPDVWVPPFKELHFFDYKFVEDSRSWARWHIKSNIRRLLKNGNLPDTKVAYLKSLVEEPILNGNWYKKVFAEADQEQMGLDVTPEYCSLPEQGIEFLLRFLNKPKIIYVIRDPVARAVSQIKMNIVRGGAAFDNIGAWQEAAQAPVIKERGDYLTYVPRWDRLVGNILYLPFREIERDPIRILRTVEKYCELKAAVYPNAASRVFSTPAVSVPEEIRLFLAKELSDQSAFLRERFGSDFVELI